MYEFPPGSTGKSVQFYLRDSSTGQPKLHLSASTPGATAGYVRAGGTGVSFALAQLASPGAPWQSGGFTEVDPALVPGVYRLDVPDPSLSSGVDFSTFTLNFENTLGEGVLVLLRNPTNNVGAGATTFAVNVLKSGSLPVAGASVWVSTDEAGLNVIAGALTTGVLGSQTFLLSDGAYFLWVLASGFTGANPTAFTVNGAGSLTVTLEAAAAPPSLTASSAHQDRYTAYDVAERLLDFTGADPKAENTRAVRRAALDAMREFPTLHKWTYYRTVYRLLFDGSYATGTIGLDVEGGAYPNMVTLTDGVWPDWAAAGQLRVGQVTAKVDRRISDTILTLKAPTYPADMDAGTAYAIFHDIYDLPADFVSADDVLVETTWGVLTYVTPAAYLERVRHDISTATPAAWTLIGSPDTPGRLAMAVWPAPDATGTADFLYSRKMREIRNFDVSDGGATVASGSPTTVTFSGAVLKADMVGSTLRLSDSAGEPPSGVDGLTPFVFEATIRRVQSANVCDLDAAAPACEDVAYRISDPIDVEATAFTAFARGAEKHIAMSKIMKTRVDAHKAWMDALTLAMEADSRVDSSRRSSVGGGRRRSLADMPFDFNVP